MRYLSPAARRYAHYTQVEPNEKEAAYWLKAASDSRIAQSAPAGSTTVRTGTFRGLCCVLCAALIADAVDLQTNEPTYAEQSKVLFLFHITLRF